MLCSNVCFVASVGNRKPNVNNQFFVLVLVTNKKDRTAWLDFFSKCTSLKKLVFGQRLYDDCNEKSKKFLFSFNLLFSFNIYLGESSVEPVTSEVTSGHGNSKYTGQYKKNTAPNKPARKHKPKSAHDHTGESRSDRSASPDNSSTSGNIFLITVLKIRKLQKSKNVYHTSIYSAGAFARN